ncbi:MAG: MBL fold metallo-hydrolase [Anaerolineae bacterium]
MLQRLSEIGVGTGDIDTVVITHGHGDHVAGILAADGAFAFPNARYIFWRSEWDYWTADERFAETPDHPMRRVWDALKGAPGTDRANRRRPAGSRDHARHVRGRRAGTHRRAHRAGTVLRRRKAAAHRRRRAQPVPDQPPGMVAQIRLRQGAGSRYRRALFERAAHEGWLLCAYHFPFPGVGRVVERDGGCAGSRRPAKPSRMPPESARTPPRPAA